VHLQNAWQTKRPEEMVESIHVEIPAGEDVNNPLEDVAFMEQIGAKQISLANSPNSVYELRNAETGTRFTFAWYAILNKGWNRRRGRIMPKSFWRFWKDKKWRGEEKDDLSQEMKE